MTFNRRSGFVARNRIRRVACETLENRLFLAAQISAVTSAHLADVVAFNAIAAGYTGAGPSRTETVTITDTGSSPLTFTAATNAGNFVITNSASLPASLASGASTTIDLQYTATALNLQSAQLKISSNDPVTPTLAIDLNGIGTPGQFGVAEPSLAQVLRAHDIPTIVGAGPNDANVNVQKYPITPDPSSQEVPMQRMVVANSALPVTITPLASFSAGTQPVSRIGYYVPGDPNTTSELFIINAADAQVVDPTAQGATSFNPGTSPFALYGTFPGTTLPDGSLDTHYSEDALNTLDPTHERKVRFFPLKNASGAVVPNSFVVAMEDFNDPTTYNSFINFVGIISNVTAAPNAAMGSTPSNTTGTNPPVMDVQENQYSPGSTTLIFNTIQTPNPIVADVVHNTNTITIYNTGDKPLTINRLTLSDTTNWALVSPPAPGTQIAGNSSLAVTIKFIATTNPVHSNNQTNDILTTDGVPSVDAGGVWAGTLTITSNDAINPGRTIHLAGYWQYQTEHEAEPNVSTITHLLLGYSTNDTGSDSTQGTEFPNNGNTPVTYGSEVDPSTDQGLLVSADGGPVTLVDIAAFHSQFVVSTASVGANEVNVDSANESGTTATITTLDPQTFTVGQNVTIRGLATAGYNGTFMITGVPTANTFTYTTTASGLAMSLPTTPMPVTGWYPMGAAPHYLYRNPPNNGQAVYPPQNPDSYSTVETTFTPTGAFGIYLDGEKSEDAQNTQNLPYMTSGHSVRFWPVIDSNGNTVPNTYFVGLDYRSYANPNGDYQDLVEIVSNVTFEAIPATPIDLQATAQRSGVNLQWAPIATATGGYNVYQSINGGAFTKLNSAPVMTNSYIDATASASSAVKYQVTSVDSAAVESLPADVSATPISNAAPAAPAIQQADGSSGTQIVLTWTASAGATSYNVEREDPGQSTFHGVATALTAATFTDTNVTTGSTYQYEVQAVSGSVASAFSAATSVSAGATIAAPTNLQTGTPSTTQVTLSWVASAGATSYDVERQGPTDSTFMQVASGLTSPTYTDMNVTAGETYMYGVRAETAVGNSAYTSAVSATVPVTAPFNVNIGAGAAKLVRFTNSSGATITIMLRNGGSAMVQFLGTGLTQVTAHGDTIVRGMDPQVSGIVATGTTAASNLNIQSNRAGVVIPIGGISTDGSFRMITGTTANLTGTLSVAGSIGQLMLGSATSAVISAAAITTFSILHSASFTLNVGAVHAMKIGGALTGSSLNFSTAGALDLATLSAGTVAGSTINAAGNLGALSLISLTDSDIYAGVGALAAGQTLPQSAADFTAQASIKSIRLSKARHAASDVGSLIAAAHIGSVLLGAVQFANGGSPFGVGATSIASLVLSDPATNKTASVRNVTDSAVASAFAKEGIVQQDFAIRIL